MIANDYLEADTDKEQPSEFVASASILKECDAEVNGRKEQGESRSVDDATGSAPDRPGNINANMKSDYKFCISSYNVRSLYNVRRQVLLSSWLDTIESDIILLQETWLQEEDFDFPFLDYNAFFAPATEAKKAGLAILVRNHHNNV